MYLVAVLQVSKQEVTTAEGKMMLKAHMDESSCKCGHTREQQCSHNSLHEFIGRSFSNEDNNYFITLTLNMACLCKQNVWDEIAETSNLICIASERTVLKAHQIIFLIPF